MIAQRVEDTYSKWIVAIVGSGLVTLLGFLGIRDRIAIDASLIRLQTVIESQSALLAKHEVELQLLKTDLKYVTEQTRENGNKLDSLLIEVKRVKK